MAGGTWCNAVSPGSRRGLLWFPVVGGCLLVALAGGGCSSSSPPPSQYPQADVDAPENWLSIPVAEFSKRCPAFVKAVAAKELKVPDSGIMRVTDEGLQSFKVRIADGVIKEAWRERPAE